MKIELILLGVIGLVFLVDFIVKGRKKSSVNETIKQIEGERGAVGMFKNPITYITNRKKNFTLFLISVPIFKLLIHYVIYPKTYSPVIGEVYDEFRRGLGSKFRSVYGDKVREGLDVHIDLLFKEELILFIPSLIILLLIIWFFNGKIKAR